MVFENFGLDQGLFDSLRESTFYSCRFFKCRARQRNETDVGLGAHSDYSFITILHQQVKGLQFKTKDGQWIDFKPSSSSFIVLAGDALMICDCALLLFRIYHNIRLSRILNFTNILYIYIYAVYISRLCACM